MTETEKAPQDKTDETGPSIPFTSEVQKSIEAHAKRVRRIQLLSIFYGIGFLLLGGLIYPSFPVVLGIFLGALIMVADFFWLARLVRQVFFIKGKTTAGFFLKFGLKFIFLLAIVALVIYFTPVNTIAFLVGLSVSVLGIITDGIIGVFRTGDGGEG